MVDAIIKTLLLGIGTSKAYKDTYCKCGKPVISSAGGKRYFCLDCLCKFIQEVHKNAEIELGKNKTKKSKIFHQTIIKPVSDERQQKIASLRLEDGKRE